MRLSLSLNTRVTVLAVALLPILLMLGNWQLRRADEKRGIEAQYLARQQQPPVTLGRLEADVDLAFMPVRLSGRFDNDHHFLLDNRMQNGQLGYEVLTPLLTDDGRWVLVNRGWIKANPDRGNLPVIPAVETVVHTGGRIYVPPGEPFLLAEQTFQEQEWPLVVQAVEVDKFASLLNRDLFPHTVRLDQGAPAAFEVDWQAINVQPEKHVAYAVQWFAMAVALVLWFVFANTNLWELVRGRSK